MTVKTTSGDALTKKGLLDTADAIGNIETNRRTFLKTTGICAGAAFVGPEFYIEQVQAADNYVWFGAGVAASIAGGLVLASSSPGWLTGLAIVGGLVVVGTIISSVVDAITDFLFGSSNDTKNSDPEQSFMRAQLHQAFDQNIQGYVRLFQTKLDEVLPFAADEWFTSAQLSACEDINKQIPKADIKKNAKEYVENQAAKIEKSVYNYYDATLEMIDFYVTEINNMNNVTIEDMFYVDRYGNNLKQFSVSKDAGSVTLINGESYDTHLYDIKGEGYGSVSTDKKPFTISDTDYFPIVDGGSNSNPQNVIVNSGGNHVDNYLMFHPEKWSRLRGSEIISKIQTKVNEVKSDIDAWVDLAVNAELSNEFSCEKLVGPEAYADSLSENQDNARALATFLTSGIAGDISNASSLQSDIKIDLGNKSTVNVQNAVLGITGKETIDEGDTISNPLTKTNQYIIGYNANNVTMKLNPNDYGPNVDGGEWKVKYDKLERVATEFVGSEHIIEIETTAGETVQIQGKAVEKPEKRYPINFDNEDLVKKQNWEPNEYNRIDIASKLANQTTNVAEIRITHNGPGTTTTKILENNFTLQEINGAITDDETGETYTPNSLTYEKSDERVRETDTFTTQEEWEQYSDQIQQVDDDIDNLRNNDDKNGGFVGFVENLLGPFSGILNPFKKLGQGIAYVIFGIIALISVLFGLNILGSITDVVSDDNEN